MSLTAAKFALEISIGVAIYAYAGYYQFLFMMISDPNSANCEFAKAFAARKSLPPDQKLALMIAVAVAILTWPAQEMLALVPDNRLPRFLR